MQKIASGKRVRVNPLHLDQARQFGLNPDQNYKVAWVDDADPTKQEEIVVLAGVSGWFPKRLFVPEQKEEQK